MTGFAKTLILTAAFTAVLAAAAFASGKQYLKAPMDPQYPPFNENFSLTSDNWSPYTDKLPATVPSPAFWPYVSSWPHAPGWTYPVWSPYSARWHYGDQYPYYEWWSYSDWLAFKDKWTYGDAMNATNQFEYPANWPYPQRWSPIDQWPKSPEPPSTADIGTIDMLNKRNEAIAYGDYSKVVEPGDRVYITRQNRLVGLARIVSVDSTYTVLQAVRVSRDYFLQIGDTFQPVAISPAMSDSEAAVIDSIAQDGRILSYFDFLSRKHTRNDMFSVRRNGQNVGTARLVLTGYGYGFLIPSEDTSPQPGDTLVYMQSPEVVIGLVKPRLIAGADKIGIFTTDSGKQPENVAVVEKYNEKEIERRKVNKLTKKKDWPDTDIWWEDTSDAPDDTTWPDEK